MFLPRMKHTIETLNSAMQCWASFCYCFLNLGQNCSFCNPEELGSLRTGTLLLQRLLPPWANDWFDDVFFSDVNKGFKGFAVSFK